MTAEAALRSWAEAHVQFGLEPARQALVVLDELNVEREFRKGCQESACEMNNMHVARIRELLDAHDETLRMLHEALSRAEKAEAELAKRGEG